MIQSVIARLANASFAIRGWAITLIVGVFALLQTGSIGSSPVAYVPIVAFWFLDAFYLSRERAYRHYFEEVRRKDEAEIDFTMDLRRSTWHSAAGFVSACFAPPTFLFYAVLSAATFALYAISAATP